jgi:hypothetical protein
LIPISKRQVDLGMTPNREHTTGTRYQIRNLSSRYKLRKIEPSLSASTYMAKIGLLQHPHRNS